LNQDESDKHWITLAEPGHRRTPRPAATSIEWSYG